MNGQEIINSNIAPNPSHLDNWVGACFGWKVLPRGQKAKNAALTVTHYSHTSVTNYSAKLRRRPRQLQVKRIGFMNWVVQMGEFGKDKSNHSGNQFLLVVNNRSIGFNERNYYGMHVVLTLLLRMWPK